MLVPLKKLHPHPVVQFGGTSLRMTTLPLREREKKIQRCWQIFLQFVIMFFKLHRPTYSTYVLVVHIWYGKKLSFQMVRPPHKYRHKHLSTWLLIKPVEAFHITHDNINSYYFCHVFTQLKILWSVTNVMTPGYSLWHAEESNIFNRDVCVFTADGGRPVLVYGHTLWLNHLTWWMKSTVLLLEKKHQAHPLWSYYILIQNHCSIIECFSHPFLPLF